VTNNKEIFKNLLKKIGSGEKTSKGLTRKESAEALKLMLTGKASPAQIGAFMIAHRIRRPEPQELSGMLDTYIELGPNLISKNRTSPPLCFGMPFDGRCRTSPIYPLTSLVLLSNGNTIVLQGGKRMPIKYGVTPIELFSTLGLNLKGLPLKQVQLGFNKNGFALIHQPDHFPLAETIIKYREELGKRPPLASMELIWTPHIGEHLILSGFVHPPTEERAWKTLEQRGEKHIILIKGLEGSIDLPTNRSCIIGSMQNGEFSRIILHAKDHFLQGIDTKWSDLKTWKKHAFQALDNKGPLINAVKWNSGVYLWLTGKSHTIQEGLQIAEESILSGAAIKSLENLISWKNSLGHKSMN